MSDTEALDLIQHYGWGLAPSVRGGWVINCIRFSTDPQPTVREAIKAAMTAQIAWATAR